MHHRWTRRWKVIANTCANALLCPFTILLYSILKGQHSTIKAMATFRAGSSTIDAMYVRVISIYSRYMHCFIGP